MMGWIGVDLFFVLSGFLVSGLLFVEIQKTGKVHAGRFLARRGFKIYPPFYVCLGVTIYGLNKRGFHFSAEQIWGEVFFLQNYLSKIAIHTWSLAVEEHFYLLLAFIFAFAGKHLIKKGVFLTTWIVVALVPLIWRLTLLHLGASLGKVLFVTHLRLDSLFAGVALAYMVHVLKIQLRINGWQRWGLFAVALSFVFPVGLAEQRSPFVGGLGLTLLWIGFSIIVLLAAKPSVEREPNRIEATLAYIGRHSYSIYLWHVPLGMGILITPLRSWTKDPGVIHTSLFLALTLVVGIAMAKFIEIPTLRLRERLLAEAPRKKISSAPGPNETRAS